MGGQGPRDLGGIEPTPASGTQSGGIPYPWGTSRWKASFCSWGCRYHLRIEVLRFLLPKRIHTREHIAPAVLIRHDRL